MNRESFNKIFECSLLPKGKQMVKELGVEFNPNFDILYNEYQKQKTFLRLLCNKLKYTNEEKDLLDKHKVCAALCIAILNSNFIAPLKNKIPADKNYNLNNYTKYNEQLALDVSLDLLKAFNKAKEKAQKPQSSVEWENYHFPTPQNNQEDYEDTIVRSLFFANTVGQLNLHLLAHIFFLIEQYHILSSQSYDSK